MKGPVIKVVEWMMVLGIFGVIVGALLPFIGWDFLGSSEYYNFFALVEDTDEYIWLGIMGVALAISAITGILVEDAEKMGVSIWMIIAAIMGEIGYRYYVSEADEYIFFEFGIGRGIMEVAYIILITAAVFSFGIDIYYLSKDNVKENVSDGYKCPQCGMVSKEKSKYCSSCGFEMKSLVCSNCGAERDCTSKFCKECGHRFSPINMDCEKNE